MNPLTELRFDGEKYDEGEDRNRFLSFKPYRRRCFKPYRRRCRRDDQFDALGEKRGYSLKCFEIDGDGQRTRRER